MEPLSLEDVASTSDDAVVRRRFDTRNLLWLFALLLFFVLVTVIELFTHIGRRNILDVAIAAPNLILVLMMIFVMRDVFRIERRKQPRGIWSVASWVRRHVTATTIVYLLLQYTLLIAFARAGNDWLGWVICFPFFMLGFRMLVSELVLVHAYLVGVGTVLALTVGTAKDHRPAIISFFVINAITMGIEVFASNRLRKEIVADWSERRGQAQEQLRMRAELQYARELQLSMLPAEAPKLDWIDLAGISMPATEVGGDYFDYFIVGDGLAIVSSDVAGHGLAAGLVLAAMRSGFTLLRDSLHDPAAVLRRLHTLVAETTRRRTLVTCAVLLLDRQARRATFASAGHPPIVMRHDGTIETINLFAPPLGVRLPFDVPHRELPFESGDVFILHTDGVYESMNERGESYGIDRIQNVVSTHDHSDAAAIRDAIVADVHRFRAGAPQSDDVTVVVAKVV